MEISTDDCKMEYFEIEQEIDGILEIVAYDCYVYHLPSETVGQGCSSTKDNSMMQAIQSVMEMDSFKKWYELTYPKREEKQIIPETKDLEFEEMTCETKEKKKYKITYIVNGDKYEQVQTLKK